MLQVSYTTFLTECLFEYVAVGKNIFIRDELAASHLLIRHEIISSNHHLQSLKRLNKWVMFTRYPILQIYTHLHEGLSCQGRN